jgi:hypothetical protein
MKLLALSYQPSALSSIGERSVATILSNDCLERGFDLIPVLTAES